MGHYDDDDVHGTSAATIAFVVFIVIIFFIICVAWMLCEKRGEWTPSWQGRRWWRQRNEPQCLEVELPPVNSKDVQLARL